MVSDEVEGQMTTVEQSSASLTSGDECVWCGWVSDAVGGGVVGLRWLCCPRATPPLLQHRGVTPILCPARHDGDSSSVTMLHVVKRIVRSVFGASPAPVKIGSRYPALPVDCRTGK